jgi:DNA-binding transcriptional regulator GbsR (MarR family)
LNLKMESVFTAQTEATVKTNPALLQLNAVEVEFIHLFIQFAGALGQPRSVAEIYGLLFASEKPMDMDALIERLNLSKGSASQGLKYLLELGAVRKVYVAGERRTHYEAVAELRKLAGRFLRQQVLTHFEESESRLEEIAVQSAKLADGQRRHITERVRLLRRWQRSGRRLMPLMLKILGGE